VATALTAAAEGRKRRAAVHPTSWPGGCARARRMGGREAEAGGGARREERSG